MKYSTLLSIHCISYKLRRIFRNFRKGNSLFLTNCGIFRNFFRKDNPLGFPRWRAEASALACTLGIHLARYSANKGKISLEISSLSYNQRQGQIG
jgi:hypothetical protein